MGALASRLPWKQIRQEDIDIWREIKLPKPSEDVPVKTQRDVIREGVISQIQAIFADSTHTSFTLTVHSQMSSNPSPGVTLNGHAVPGRIICFFPGIVYPRITEMPHYPRIALHNPYLMATTDGCVIDASRYQPLSSELAAMPLAVGHFVRHPPEGCLPNVMPYTLHVPKISSQDFVQHIPNQYYQRAPSNIVALHTIVFVAMRHIKNEELFINYRFYPQQKLPSWYCSVDKEEDKRRWKKIYLH